jgi:hypothetical protein
MPNRIITSILAGMAIFAFSSILIAQRPPRRPATSSPRTSTSNTDLSGIWMVSNGVNPTTGVNRRRFLRGEPPRLPWAEEQYQAARKGVPDLNEQGLDELDPIESCFPPSPARLANLPRPFEIIQFPNRVLFLTEWDHWVRYIWTDGRTHGDSYLTSRTLSRSITSSTIRRPIPNPGAAGKSIGQSRSKSWNTSCARTS